jgi:hypothetical protein
MEKLQTTAIEELKNQFRGEIILPGDNNYGNSRQIWNGFFDRKPAIIARCIGSSDVINAVNFARNNNLSHRRQGRGHNSAGYAACDDGIMIDLSLMRRVLVDKDRKTAQVDNRKSRPVLGNPGRRQLWNCNFL